MVWTHHCIVRPIYRLSKIDQDLLCDRCLDPDPDPTFTLQTMHGNIGNIPAKMAISAIHRAWCCTSLAHHGQHSRWSWRYHTTPRRHRKAPQELRLAIPMPLWLDKVRARKWNLDGLFPRKMFSNCSQLFQPLNQIWSYKNGKWLSSEHLRCRRSRQLTFGLYTHMT